MSTRKQNGGVRKVCECPRRTWAKCLHSWNFNFKPKGGEAVRFAIDAQEGKHIESKTEADALADGYRTTIRNGTFRRNQPTVTPATDALTLHAFTDRYFERRGKPASDNEKSERKRFEAFHGYGESPLTAITEDCLELFVMGLREEDYAASTVNKYIQYIKALFRWATKKGYLIRNPAADSDVLKRSKTAQRHRRLEPDEEDGLLANAETYLQRIIIAAMETCCRRGELLALQWRDVNMQRLELTIRAEEEGARKTGVLRVLPISPKLAGILEMAKTDPTGKEWGPLDYVFGDVVGRKVCDISRAWECCVLKTHRRVPGYTKTNALNAGSRAALAAIDLHFHDLRHEAGSRLLELGWKLHNVSKMLGHANIAQTSTYLNATKVGLADEMRRLNSSRCISVAENPTIERPLNLQRKRAKRQQVHVN